MSYSNYGSSYQNDGRNTLSSIYQSDNQNVDASGYRRMIRMAARMFYAAECPPLDKDPERDNPRSKISKLNTRGLGVIVLDYLSRGEWHEESNILKDLQVNQKLLRKALQYLEQEQVIQRYDKRDKRRKARAMGEEVDEFMSGRVAAQAESSDDENDANRRGYLVTYFAIDYSRAHDTIRLKLHRMRAKFDGPKPKILQYVCHSPMCGRRTYSSLDAAML
eukprot:CAMPEP_0175040806 /NCGR_PEP_ID=MMETSP0052_2-20121109/1496_1 /TAXON_ID=51329 ORGANISM="Polytomella parva, Strain SAG 63-3" /NCGR_SAMPLE_ID=MMETSP0052_2 /ASSEMBLY_ACC=CAM_ASM_000194 /LENGTH=219 /DNA_ID=CAMNT_0016303115 /DNA_START=40 /DNA_END=696 /DNA_ORIENTATION=-